MWFNYYLLQSFSLINCYCFCFRWSNLVKKHQKKYFLVTLQDFYITFYYFEQSINTDKTPNKHRLIHNIPRAETMIASFFRTKDCLNSPVFIYLALIWKIWVCFNPRNQAVRCFAISLLQWAEYIILAFLATHNNTPSLLYLWI